MGRVTQVVVIGLLSASCSRHATQMPPDPVAYLAGTSSRVITSTTTGRTYQVSVALPRGYEASSASYPVLYALDANGHFGIVVETARLLEFEKRIPPLVIVGIGYPLGYFFDTLGKRPLDLTVTEDRTWQFPIPDLPPLEGTGGGPEFFQFLTGELMPLVQAEYRVDEQDRTLLGHSFGGLFAFHALLHGQDAFERFVIISPSLWWDDRVAFQQEEAYAAANRGLAARAFFSVGLNESEQHVASVRDLVPVLTARNYEGFTWTAHFFEDESHDSVVPASISRGLRYVYGTE